MRSAIGRGTKPFVDFLVLNRCGDCPPRTAIQCSLGRFPLMLLLLLPTRYNSPFHHFDQLPSYRFISSSRSHHLSYPTDTSNRLAPRKFQVVIQNWVWRHSGMLLRLRAPASSPPSHAQTLWVDSARREIRTSAPSIPTLSIDRIHARPLCGSVVAHRFVLLKSRCGHCRATASVS